MDKQLLTLSSFAKINLFLKISGKRSDEFHEICTAFQTISLCDYLTFYESDRLLLKTNDENLSDGEENLILKAARKLLEKSGKNLGAEIHLEKNIPFPGGLGGGSSNAAAALLGLNFLWNLDLSFEELKSLGTEIGSDVPFFFHGGTALGTGRGTEIEQVEDFSENFLLLVVPDIAVSTARAYQELNAGRLTKKDSKSILTICRNLAEKLNSTDFEPSNDFEKVIFKLEPKLKFIKNRFLESGAKSALMSGSGASVFGIFDNEEKRQKAFEAFSAEENLRVFAVQTVSRREYLREFRAVLKN